MSTRPDARAAWAAAALGAALTAWVFWPGLMSVDSALQYAQARGLRDLDDVLPPLMTLAWRGLDALWRGPGAMFLLLVVAWWSGLAAVLAQLPLRRAPMFLLVLGIGLFPSLLVMLGHVWKDVAMCAALLWATAATLAHAREASPPASRPRLPQAGVPHAHDVADSPSATPDNPARGATPEHAAPRVKPGAAARARWRWLALLALALACTMRHNAIVAALPLLAWLVFARNGATDRAGALRKTATFVVLAGALAVAPTLVTHAVRARPTQAWTVVALWDLAAVSAATGQVLIPRELTFDTVTVDELRAAYVPYANPPLFGIGKFYVSLYQPYIHAKVRLLQRAWWQAASAHPREYLQHRATLSRYLLFGIPQELPRELVYVPQRVPVPGSGYEPPPVDAGAPGWRLVEALRPTPLFAGATYLALAALAVALARRRHAPGSPARGAVSALAASAWANALALLVVSGSAEFRYLAWSALAALLALALACVRGAPRIG